MNNDICRLIELKKIDKACRLKKNDKVKVITGKDSGKVGKVLKVIKKNNRVLIEHINKVKEHQKPTATNRQGGIIEREAPIHWSNVMLVCNKCMQTTRIQSKKLENDKKVRVCKKCKEIIDE